MIRVNLLKNRREPVDGLEAAIAATGPSAFINRREVVFGALFLALGAGILYINAVAAGSPEADLSPAVSASDEIAPGPAAEQPVNIETSRREIAAPLASPPTHVRPPADMPAPAVSSDLSSAPSPPRPATVRQAAPTTPKASAAKPVRPQPAASQPAPRPSPHPAVAANSSPHPKPGPAPVPGQLSALAVSSRGPNLHILATIGNQPAYKMFRLNSPNRVVVDLRGVTLALPASQRQITPSHSLVKRIRIAQYQVSPPTVRVVFDVPDFPEVAINPAPGGLAFQVAAPSP